MILMIDKFVCSKPQWNRIYSEKRIKNNDCWEWSFSFYLATKWKATSQQEDEDDNVNMCMLISPFFSRFHPIHVSHQTTKASIQYYRKKFERKNFKIPRRQSERRQTNLLIILRMEKRMKRDKRERAAIIICESSSALMKYSATRILLREILISKWKL